MTENLDQYLTGSAECLDCEKHWYAVWPPGAEALECPRCGGTNTDREIIDNRDASGRAVKFRMILNN